MLVLLFRTLSSHLFSMLCFSWSINISRFMERQTGMIIEQFNGISQDPVFILKLILFYSCIDYGVRSNSLLENA